MSGVRVTTARPDRPRAAPPGAARPGAAARVLRAALLASALVAVAVFHIWSRTRVLATGYELGEQAKAHARLSSEHDRLRIEVETLRSPVKLEQYARTKLGMAPPAPGTVWVAGPRLASASAGGAGVDGVDRRPAPAGSLLAGGHAAPQTPGRSGRGSSASPSAPALSFGGGRTAPQTPGRSGGGSSASPSAPALSFGGGRTAPQTPGRSGGGSSASPSAPAVVPGEQVAFRGPLRAGRAPLPARERE